MTIHHGGGPGFPPATPSVVDLNQLTGAAGATISVKVEPPNQLEARLTETAQAKAHRRKMELLAFALAILVVAVMVIAYVFDGNDERKKTLVQGLLATLTAALGFMAGKGSEGGKGGD